MKAKKNLTKFVTTHESNEHMLLKTFKTKTDGVWILDSGQNRLHIHR